MTDCSIQDALRSRGFSIVELMVALTIGLILVAGLMTLVVGNIQGYGELSKSGYQVDNARFSNQLLRDEISNAGYYGDLSFVPGFTSLPAAPCNTALSNVDARYMIPLQGVNEYSSSNSALACKTGLSIKAGTDMLLVRRAASTAVALAARDAAKLYLASSADAAKVLASDTDTGAVSFLSIPRFQNVRAYQEKIFFVSTCNVCSGNDADTIPTLKVIELKAAGWEGPTALVEGIEELELEYGLDSDEDGAVNSFVSLPNSAAQWASVAAVRFSMLVRNIETSTNVVSKSYQVGPDLLTKSDSFKRHAYSMTVRLRNSAERREL